MVQVWLITLVASYISSLICPVEVDCFSRWSVGLTVNVNITKAEKLQLCSSSRRYRIPNVTTYLKITHYFNGRFTCVVSRENENIWQSQDNAAENYTEEKHIFSSTGFSSAVEISVFEPDLCTIKVSTMEQLDETTHYTTTWTCALRLRFLIGSKSNLAHNR